MRKKPRHAGAVTLIKQKVNTTPPNCTGAVKHINFEFNPLTQSG